MIGQTSPERPGGRFDIPSRWTVPGWGQVFPGAEPPLPEDVTGAAEPPDNGAGLPPWATEAPPETPPAAGAGTPAPGGAAAPRSPTFPKLTARELTVAAVVLGLVFAGPYLLRRWR